MENKLLKKLLIREGNTLLIHNAPDEIAQIVGDIPSTIKLVFMAGKITYEGILLFAKNSVELKQSLPKVLKNATPDTSCWIAYPKKASGIPTDLSMTAPWNAVEEHGYDLVASAAISDNWTAVRIRPQGQLKLSGTGNEEIPNNEYGALVDVANRVVAAPPDLEAAFKKEPVAKVFFNSLSFTNKKEYVIWILSAKQEKTRTDRILKTVEKLVAGKKNPSDK